jgi:transposase-like protein
LGELQAEDIFSEYEAEYRRLSESDTAYIVKCPFCNAVYSWDPSSEHSEGQCTACSKTFNIEFGEVP